MTKELKELDLEVTEEKLQKAAKITQELSKLKDIQKDQVNTAKDRFSGVKHKMKNSEGKEIEVTEKECWTDYYYNAKNAGTFEILNKKYPEIFEIEEKISKLAIELKTFFISEFGIDYTSMTITDNIRLNLGLISYQLNRVLYKMVEKIVKKVFKQEIRGMIREVVVDELSKKKFNK